MYMYKNGWWILRAFWMYTIPSPSADGVVVVVEVMVALDLLLACSSTISTRIALLNR